MGIALVTERLLEDPIVYPRLMEISESAQRDLEEFRDSYESDVEDEIIPGRSCIEWDQRSAGSSEYTTLDSVLFPDSKPAICGADKAEPQPPAEAGPAVRAFTEQWMSTVTSSLSRLKESFTRLASALLTPVRRLFGGVPQKADGVGAGAAGSGNAVGYFMKPVALVSAVLLSALIMAKCPPSLVRTCSTIASRCVKAALRT